MALVLQATQTGGGFRHARELGLAEMAGFLTLPAVAGSQRCQLCSFDTLEK